jgi:dTDP-4-amino-4,6-dideoxygalactose transaminase
LGRAARSNALPRAIIPTDLYGQPCDLDAIVEAAAAYEIPVIADSAEAVGARYRGRHAGNGAWTAAYSFNGTKIITTSGGGMLASDDETVIARARYLSQAARQPVPHYEHTEVGYNYRLSNISAAIGRGQLLSLEQRVTRRRQIFALYEKLLSPVPGLSFMPEMEGTRANRWLSVLVVDKDAFGCDSEALRLALEAHNIESRPVWKPMHLQPAFRGLKCIGGELSEKFFDSGLCLPSGSQMSDSEVVRVAEIVASRRAEL